MEEQLLGALLELEEDGQTQTKEYIDSLEETYAYYVKEQRLHEAIEYKERALRTSVDLQLLSTPFFIESLTLLTDLAKQAGDFDLAYGYASEAAERAKEEYGENSLDHSLALLQLALVSNVEDAVELLQSVLSVLAEGLGENNEHTKLARDSLLTATRALNEHDHMQQDVGSMSALSESQLGGGDSISTLGDAGLIAEPISSNDVAEGEEEAEEKTEKEEKKPFQNAALSLEQDPAGPSSYAVAATADDEEDIREQILLNSLSKLSGTGESDDDLSNMTEKAQSLKTVHSVLRLAKTSSIVEDGSHLKFSISYLELPEDVASKYMCRTDEEAYRAAVGVVYEMAIFPAQLKEGGRYHAEYVQVSRYCMAFRIRRLLLLDEIASLDSKLNSYRELQALCVQKKEAHHTRLVMLEEEMEHLAVEKQGDAPTPGSRMSALISIKPGWSILLELLTRECKRLQQPEGKQSLAGEDVNEALTLEAVFEIYDLMQIWQLFNSVRIRCRMGIKHYPIHAKEVVRVVEPEPEDEIEEESLSLPSSRGKPTSSSSSKKISKKMPKGGKKTEGGEDVVNNTTSGASPEPSLLDVQFEKLRIASETANAAKGDEVNLDAEANGSAFIADGNSSLASESAAVLLEDDMSLDSGVNSKGSEGRNNKNKKQENSTPPPSSKEEQHHHGSKGKEKKHKGDEEAQSTEASKAAEGGWGWGGLMNMFGKKEEVVEEVAAPVMRTLVPLVHGHGIGEWSEVCEALGCEPQKFTLKSAAEAVIAKIESTPAIANLMPIMLKSDFTLSLKEMSSVEETNSFLGLSLFKVLSIIGDLIEEKFLESLRLFSNWFKFLESMRKERLRKTGQKIDETAAGTVEVDKHGAVRIIPHSDQIVDTDILHGNRQRVQVHVVMPQLAKLMDAAVVTHFKLKGELAAVMQFGYTFVVPFVQRAIRGTLGRMKRNMARRDLTLYSMHAACVYIQGWVRAIQGKELFARSKVMALGSLKEDKARVLQRHLRMWTKWHKHNRYVTNKKAKKLWFGITMFQALIRGFNARHRVRRIKAQKKKAAKGEIAEWSVVGIQRVARGYIARKTIIRSLHIRKSLSKRVLLLSEKYLKGGDLWGFLKEVDSEFSRLGKEISTNAAREEEMAATFVKQVLQQRQGEFDGAWSRFTRTVTAQGSRPGGGGEEDEKQKQGETILSAVGGGSASQKTSWGASGGGSPDGKQQGPHQLDNAIPGPMLRRAVSATIQEGVTQEVQRQKNEGSRSVKMTKEFRGVYEPESTFVRGETKKNGKSGGTKQRGGRDSFPTSKSLDTMNLGGTNAVLTRDATPPVLMVKKKKGKGQGKGKITANTMDWTAKAAAAAAGSSSTTSLSGGGNGSPIRPKTSEETGEGWSPKKVEPGESLLVDVPKGMDDTMERLLRAAAMKCYVPEFSQCADAASAYALYKKMPPGLAKMRYEQECQKYAQGAINLLRIKGVVKIKDAMPVNRFRQYLQSVDCPLPLMTLSMRWLGDLIKMGDLPAGLVHQPTATLQANILESKGTIKQVLAAAPPSTKPAVEFASQSLASNLSISDNNFGRGSTSSVEEGEAGEEESAAEGEDDTVQISDPSLPGRLLVNLVEGGQWADLRAPADDLLLHAAFLVVPHVGHKRLKNGTVKEVVSPMGHAAFKAHSKAVAAANSDEERRELVRARFRAALLLTTPFSLRLRADGTSTVMDLVNRSDLNSLKFPPMLLSQIESLLSTAVSLSVSSKVAPTIRDHLTTSKEMFTVPMIFDPRFQRGPFDPYGRAPRLVPVKPLVKKKPGKPLPSTTNKNPSLSSPIIGGGEGIGGEGDKDDDEHMPEGLWNQGVDEESETLYMKNAKKLYAFKTEQDIVDKKKKKSKRSGGKKGNRSGEDQEVEEAQEGSETQAAAVAGSSSLAAPNDTEQQEQRQRSRDEKNARDAHIKMLSHDFEYKVRSGFERPYACSFPGCGEAFSRAYTLKIHEKSHKLFANYHKFRKEPQLFLDADNETTVKDAKAARDARTVLPPLVQADLNQLRKSAAAKAFALTFGASQDAFSFDDESNGGEQQQQQQQQQVDPFDDNGLLSWPGFVDAIPALNALGRLPPSREAETPYSPIGTSWQHRDVRSPSPLGFSRTGTARGFSRSSARTPGSPSSSEVRFGVSMFLRGDEEFRPGTGQTEESVDTM